MGANISQEQLAQIAERTLAESETDDDRQITFEAFKEVCNRSIASLIISFPLPQLLNFYFPIS